MDRKIKFLSILSLLIGIVVSVDIFTSWFSMLFSSLLPCFILGIIGFILSIWSLKKSSSLIEKIIAVCGLVLNTIPIGYFILLYFALS